MADIRREANNVYRTPTGEKLYELDRPRSMRPSPRLEDIKEEGDASKAMTAEIKAILKHNSNLEARLELMTERVAKLREENTALKAVQATAAVNAGYAPLDKQ